MNRRAAGLRHPRHAASGYLLAPRWGSGQRVVTWVMDRAFCGSLGPFGKFGNRSLRSGHVYKAITAIPIPGASLPGPPPPFSL